MESLSKTFVEEDTLYILETLPLLVDYKRENNPNRVKPSNKRKDLQIIYIISLCEVFGHQTCFVPVNLSGFYFKVNIHLHYASKHGTGRTVTKSYVPQENRTFISSSIVFFQATCKSVC